MKVQPIASPAAIPPQGTPEHVRTARAVAAFNRGVGGSQPEQPIVQNQNAVSAEELGAITAPIASSGQDATLEAPVTAPEAPPQAPEVDPTTSKQWAQLARQEKQLRLQRQQQDQAFKQREAALVAREAEVASRQPQDMSRYIDRDRLKADPLSVLAENEVSWDSLTQQVLNTTPTDPRVQATISKLQAKIEKLEAQNEQSAKSYTENQQAQYDAAVKQIRMDATSLVSSDPEFATIKATGSVKDVVDLITKTYEKDGILLSVEDAAKEVEEYLVEEATKLARLDKIQKRLQTVNSAKSPAPQQQPKAPQQQQPMKTLTNAASSTRQLSAKERAILAFKGELKS